MTEIMAISGAPLQAPNTEGWVDPNSKTKKPKKNIDFSLHSLWGLGAPPVIQPEVFTASGPLPCLSLSLTFTLVQACTHHNMGLAYQTVTDVGHHLRLWSNCEVHELGSCRVAA